MRKSRLMSIAAACIIALSSALVTSGCMFLPPEDDSTIDLSSYRLIWSDEFNGSSNAPDNSKWDYDIGAGGWGNNEVQTYTDARTNSSVSNGTLKVTALKDNGSWTSARLKTQGKYSFTYGYIEARIKLPAGKGPWPAFWMLGNNITSVNWPRCGEIDVMEYSPGVVGVNKVFGTIHYPNISGGHEYTSIGELVDPTVTSAFHTYGVKWERDKMTWYVDGKKVGTPFLKRSDIPWPFDKPFFIILNVAMGGNLGGTIDTNLTQATMEIDYVRLYQ